MTHRDSYSGGSQLLVTFLMSIMVMPAFPCNILPNLIVRFSFFDMPHIHINDAHSLSCTVLRFIPQSSNKGQSDPGKPRIMPTRRLCVRRWSRNPFLRLRTTCIGIPRDSWPTCIDEYDSTRILIRPAPLPLLREKRLQPLDSRSTHTGSNPSESKR